ncbi:site-specific DNA-methyltransferase [Candidatus Gracilibacteria bacterium]|nr:site-specific DNA-methyltransferase [Candidatus Gracilibacteria bacterium]
MDKYINKIINADGLEIIRQLPSKSINLICIDPPYNIGRDSWDIIVDYYDWMSDYFIEFNRILKDNGSFFMFHNDFRTLAELDRRIQYKTQFVYKNFIVWNKRFDGSPNKGFLDGFIVVEDLNNFQKMVEYIIFYTFNNSYKLLEKRKQLNITQSTIGKEILSKTGGLTGWYSNIEMGKNYPTKKTIKPITKYLGLTIDDIVPKFRNQKTHHSVWNYDLDHKKYGHITPKPVNLIENIILHTTDENDICLDCFGGSGSLAVAAIKTNRQYILIEKNENYCKIANDRISNIKTGILIPTIKNTIRKKSKKEQENILKEKIKEKEEILNNQNNKSKE